MGLGIDEYGNFLNGYGLMPGYTGTNTPLTPYGSTGDNTTSGMAISPIASDCAAPAAYPGRR